MLLLIIFYLSLVALWCYDDLLVVVAEFVYLERGRIVRYGKGFVQVVVAIEGSNYDIFLPHDSLLRSQMSLSKITADRKQLRLFPGHLPLLTVKEMNYKQIVVNFPGRRKLRFKGDQLITIVQEESAVHLEEAHSTGTY